MGLRPYSAGDSSLLTTYSLVIGLPPIGANMGLEVSMRTDLANQGVALARDRKNTPLCKHET